MSDEEAGELVAGPRLQQLERVIDRGRQAFIDVGHALREIRDRRLYRDSGHETFQQYCAERWGFERAHAYRLIDSADVVDAVSPVGDIPVLTNEAQVRELKRLPKHERGDARVLEEVLREAAGSDGLLTARGIRQVVNRRANPAAWGSTPPPPAPPLPASKPAEPDSGHWTADIRIPSWQSTEGVAQILTSTLSWLSAKDWQRLAALLDQHGVDLDEDVLVGVVVDPVVTTVPVPPLPKLKEDLR